jgi:hypothetical protein
MVTEKANYRLFLKIISKNIIEIYGGKDDKQICPSAWVFIKNWLEKQK